MATANTAETGRLTEIEVMTADELVMNYDEKAHAGAIVILIPDSGLSIFKPPHEYEKKVGDTKVKQLTRPVYSIVNVGGYRPVAMPRGFTFDNGEHAREPLSLRLEVFAMQTNGKVKPAETEKQPETGNEPENGQ